MKHTPAPWIVKSPTNIKGDGWTRIMSNGVQIAKVNALHPAGKREAGDFEQETANARLIAAAPELLEALQALFENCAMTHNRWGDGDNTKEADAAIQAARAAIAKATGNS